MDEYSTNGVEMRAIKCMEHDSLAGSFGERCNCDTCYQATRIAELEDAMRKWVDGESTDVDSFDVMAKLLGENRQHGTQGKG